MATLPINELKKAGISLRSGCLSHFKSSSVYARESHRILSLNFENGGQGFERQFHDFIAKLEKSSNPQSPTETNLTVIPTLVLVSHTPDIFSAYFLGGSCDDMPVVAAPPAGVNGDSFADCTFIEPVIN
ncbi:hypothetical protein EB093_08900, partial [bacterium]|nr:hypothetical protein [bacterium]